jgi:hypothetical protein
MSTASSEIPGSRTKGNDSLQRYEKELCDLLMSHYSHRTLQPDGEEELTQRRFSVHWCDLSQLHQADLSLPRNEVGSVHMRSWIERIDLHCGGETIKRGSNELHGL